MWSEKNKLLSLLFKQLHIGSLLLTCIGHFVLVPETVLIGTAVLVHSYLGGVHLVEIRIFYIMTYRGKKSLNWMLEYIILVDKDIFQITCFKTELGLNHRSATDLWFG